MVLALLLLIGLATLIFWLYRINKEYYVLAFFAKRVRTNDGRPVESIAPVCEGRTIFGNSFDLYGMDDVEVFKYIHERSEKMGCSYLEYVMGSAIYNIIDADNFEFIVNHKDLITKGIVYDFMQPALRLGLLTSSGQKWHSRRKLLTPTFHFNILGQFNEVFKAESLKLVKQFEDNAETSVSLSELIPRFTLNSICETAMGINLDDMAAKGDRYRENFSMIEKRFVKRIGNPLFWNNTIYNLFGPSDEKTFLKEIHDFSSEIIAKRRTLFAQEIKDKQSSEPEEDDIYIKKKQRFAMLDTLIMAEKDGAIDHEGICEQVDTLMFGGFDTTSIGLIFGLMNMGLYPEEQELCYQEICEHIADDFSNLDVNQLSKLKYLDCFIKETMRLYPSAPSIGRQTIKDTELANGLILPAGAQIVLNIYELHRNPKYWSTPEEFRPERFLPENSKDRHTYAYMPFSAGQRNCIGQKYAMLEMKTLMSVILTKFKILPIVNPKDLVFNSGITLGCKTNVKVKLVRRSYVEQIFSVTACCLLSEIERTTRRFEMGLGLLLLIGLGTLIVWLYRINKEYYVLAFFAKRVRTKDGRPVESIAPIAESRTIFGNSFDLFGMDDVEVFEDVHLQAQKIGRSYLEYVMGSAIFNIIDADNFEFIVNHKDLITKGIVYDFMQPALRLGLLTSSGQKWHSRRKLLTPTFHFNILGQFNEVFKAEGLKFVQQFEGNAETSVSLSELIPRFTLNSICETAMGIKLDDMAAKGDRYRENFSMIEKRFIKRASNPLYWNNTIYNLFGPSDEKTFLKEIHDFSSEIIAKRRTLFAQEIKDKQSSDPEDEDIYTKKKQRFAMLDTLIMAEKDGAIDHEGICEQVDTLMFAGFDTTSIGLIFGLMNMGLYQEQQELCYQEICEHIADDFSNLDVNQLSKLKYLDCFIKETMRLYPSAPSIGRQTTKDTELGNGLILPAGSQIILNIYELHRNPNYWSSPLEFQPERFLPENSKDRHTYAYMPFSAGQRNCIGQKYAMLEMKTFITVIIKKFKILPIFHPKDLRLSLGITLGFKNNINVKLVRRS
ncbi:uncharacterized protein LOC111604142 [Drosophila hydei]|uniref:Uncharacterized protein LOC111604142 n=1 Tax=Drosophila hydei TaxID=7224 RepID=A0A6J2SU84_DROHY|nr:uncharacterized protein LOC111604142 [Drosophila hydei]